MKQLSLLCLGAFVLLTTSFALGWFMRGDAIYSAMYKIDLNNAKVENIRK